MDTYENAKTEDVGQEKHLPVIRTNGNKVMVSVGSMPHPMENNHYIEWIELETNLDSYRKTLRPGEAPTAEFILENGEYAMNVYAQCNVHGLWVKRMPKAVRSSCEGVVYIWDN